MFFLLIVVGANKNKLHKGIEKILENTSVFQIQNAL